MSSSIRPGHAVGRSAALYITLALVGASFSATGPVAIIIDAAKQGGLSVQQTSSWLFAVLGINGIASIAMSLWTRQPLVFLWTIPGTVLTAPVIAQYGLSAAVGVYFCCAGVLVVLAWTRVIRLLDRWVPGPVVMAMIAALFVRYALAIVHAALAAPGVGITMVVAYFGLIWLEQRTPYRLPPIIGAAVAGGIDLALSGYHLSMSGASTWLATPILTAPTWNVHAISELLAPMLVTIIFVQNAQGIAVARAAGYPASLSLVTYCSAILTCFTAPFGGCPSVLAGPCNAILMSEGKHGQHYIAAVIASVLFVMIGAMATGYALVLTHLPQAFTAILAGLALLGVLQKSFTSAFSSTLPLSALVVFVVTLSDISVLHIGASFWALLAGCAVAHTLEKPKSAPVIS